MLNRTMMLAVAALTSTQVSAADVQSVYVAPGGVYIASARVYVTPGPANGEAPYGAPASTYHGPNHHRPAYHEPAYHEPRYHRAPAHEGPAYYAPGSSYAPPVSAYGQAARAYAAPPRAYVKREPAYVARAYAQEFAPRPPAAVPQSRPQRCVIALGYGRWEYCD